MFTEERHRFGIDTKHILLHLLGVVLNAPMPISSRNISHDIMKTNVCLCVFFQKRVRIVALHKA